MKKILLILAITIYAGTGVIKLLDWRIGQPQNNHIGIVSEQWQRESTYNVPTYHWHSLVPTQRATTNYQSNYRSSTINKTTATTRVNYNFSKPLKNTSFGTGSFGNGTSNFSSNRKLSRTSSNNFTSTGTLSSNITFRSKNTTNTREVTTTEESEELLAMVTPFSPMMAPPTVGGDFGGETPDLGVEDATDDTGVDIETTAPLGNAWCLLPFVALYFLQLLKKQKQPKNRQHETA
ncbi:MAG TPA: hypothetical protein PK557_07925 [Paludibacteraceae bacterium]|nr:hypothetical protein [Paludibacteraceae bacterium]